MKFRLHPFFTFCKKNVYNKNLKTEVKLMKGQNIFTTSESQKIRNLIEEKVIASPNEQKAIRERIRNIGFYYSDFSPRKDGYTVSDFEKLINSKQITIIDDRAEF